MSSILPYTVNLPILSTVNLPSSNFLHSRYISRMETIEELQAYIETAFKVTGLNQNSLSIEAGLGKEGVRNIMRGHMPGTNKIAAIKKVVERFKKQQVTNQQKIFSSSINESDEISAMFTFEELVEKIIFLEGAIRRMVHILIKNKLLTKKEIDSLIKSD